MRHHHRATGAGMTTGATTTAASATATMSATGAPRGTRDDTLSAARPPCPRRRPPAPGLTRPAWAGTTTAAATTATTAAAKRRAERGAPAGKDTFALHGWSMVARTAFQLAAPAPELSSARAQISTMAV